MGCTPLLQAAKPVWANQLTRLPSLVVYGNFNLKQCLVNLIYCRSENEVTSNKMTIIIVVYTRAQRPIVSYFRMLFLFIKKNAIHIMTDTKAKLCE